MRNSYNMLVVEPGVTCLIAAHKKVFTEASRGRPIMPRRTLQGSADACGRKDIIVFRDDIPIDQMRIGVKLQLFSGYMSQPMDTGNDF